MPNPGNHRAPANGTGAQPQKDPVRMAPTSHAGSGDDVTSRRERGRKTRRVNIRRLLKEVLYNRMFIALQTTALTFALFGGGIWTLADIPDKPGIAVLDALMLCVTFFFILEIILMSVVEVREYVCSSFFWMDILGTFSMSFEISFLLGSAGKLSESDDGNLDLALLRAVRATKVAARAARLTKILKCISAFQIRRFRGEAPGSTADAMRDLESGHRVQAKILSARLEQTLSTKVSLLTLALVLVVPLFQIGTYPEEDLSMRAWTQRLEDDYGRAYEAVNSGGVNQTDIFRRTLVSFMEFYADTEYHPYLVTGFPSVVTLKDGRVVEILDLPMPLAKEPVRKSSIVVQAVPSCVVEREACHGGQAEAFFDFTGPYKVSAAMDISTIFFIVAVMAAASANLTSTLDTMVVRPIEQILNMLKRKASRVLKRFGEDDDEDDDEGKHPTRKSEAELLEQIFSKLARLATLASGGNVATEAELMALDEVGKGVMVDMMQVEVVANAPSFMTKQSTNMDPSLTLQSAVEGNDPLDRELLESWNCDLLSMDPGGIHKVALYIHFDSHWRAFLASHYADVETFGDFCNAVRANYNDLPYHNYIHATDTCHTTYRLMRASGVSRCFSDIEKYALLVAAMGHDLGHQGLTNQFLVETKHELALRWHDRSPLENMHCAKLFEICSHTESNVFKNADKAEIKQARKVCIAAILHTDLALHMDMVKNINRMYEMSSDICEGQAAGGSNMRTAYDEIFRKDSIMWLEMFLHMADIANQLKPFHICEPWAHRITAEFFNQGDAEKRFGLPVGMLNDREKINKLGAHHGFVNFLVAPLVFAAVDVCPPLHFLGTQMVSNLSMWLRLWVEDANPAQDDVNKRDMDIKRLQELAEKQRARCGQ